MQEKPQDQDVVRKNLTPADQTPAVLEVEEVEAVIVPKLAANHNETILS